MIDDDRSADADACYEVRLIPRGGSGRLTMLDVEVAVERLSPGGAVVVRIDDCDDFEPGTPGRLARELSGLVVRHEFGPRARRIGRDWLMSYDVAAAEYLAVEGSPLALNSLAERSRRA